MATPKKFPYVLPPIEVVSMVLGLGDNSCYPHGSCSGKMFTAFKGFILLKGSPDIEKCFFGAARRHSIASILAG